MSSCCPLSLKHPVQGNTSMDYTPNIRMFQTEGFEEFENQLMLLAQGMKADAVARNTMVKAAKEAMEPVFNTAIQMAPYDEKNKGPVHLRDTIRLDARIPTEKDRMSKYIEPTDAVVAIVSAKKSSVSLAQEFGNARTPMHPFLRPALDTNAQNVVNALGQKLGSFIEDYAAKLNRRRK